MRIPKYCKNKSPLMIPSHTTEASEGSNDGDICRVSSVPSYTDELAYRLLCTKIKRIMKKTKQEFHLGPHKQLERNPRVLKRQSRRNPFIELRLTLSTRISRTLPSANAAVIKWGAEKRRRLKERRVLCTRIRGRFFIDRERS